MLAYVVEHVVKLPFQQARKDLNHLNKPSFANRVRIVTTKYDSF